MKTDFHIRTYRFLLVFKNKVSIANTSGWYFLIILRTSSPIKRNLSANSNFAEVLKHSEKITICFGADFSITVTPRRSNPGSIPKILIFRSLTLFIGFWFIPTKNLTYIYRFIITNNVTLFFSLGGEGSVLQTAKTTLRSPAGGLHRRVRRPIKSP